MANNLWTAFIADNGSNDIFAASSADGATWTPSVPINQTSPFTPSLALFEGVLYCAFITDDENSVTGVPSNRIFLCWTTDGVTWSQANFINHHSKCAPSLAVWNGKLHIAFVKNDSSNALLYFSSSPQSALNWSQTVATNHISGNAPSLAAYGPAGAASQLYLAFVGNGSTDILVTSIAEGGQWTKSVATGHSCHFSPSLAVLGETLYLVFAGSDGSKDLTLSSLQANGSWSAAVPMNQSSSATPGAAAFGSDLSVAFVANDPGGELLLVSATNPASWVGGNVDVKQQSAAGPAMAVAPFACSWELIPFAGLGGSTQYIFWTGLGADNHPIPVQGLVIEIAIDEAIVVSPTSGETSAIKNPLPIGFQINGFPPKADTQPGQVTTGWTPTPGDKAVGWMQFGVKMWPDTTSLIPFTEYWPPSFSENIFNPPVTNPVVLPNDLTIPAGWKIRFVFSQLADGTITGYACTVTDENGNVIQPPLGMNLLDPATCQLATGGPITLADLSQMVAFQVVLVGFWASAQATLVSGGGTITVQASTPLTVQTTWPGDADGSNGTAEDTNSTYTLLPAGPSKTFTQTFGVS